MKVPEQKGFEAGIAELVEKAFNVEAVYCHKITNLQRPFEGVQTVILVNNQMGQSLLVETDNVDEAINQFHLHYAESIDDLEVKLFYTKTRFGKHERKVHDYGYYFVDPALIGGNRNIKYLPQYRYLPVPLYDIAKPLGDDNPNAYSLTLPLEDGGSPLSHFPIRTDCDIFEPVLYLDSNDGQLTPCVCLVIETAPEDVPLPNLVSLLAKPIQTIGFFPVIYGASRLFSDDSDKDAVRMENFSANEKYYICTCSEKAGVGALVIDKMLALEHYDYLTSDGCISGNNIIDWSRLDKSLKIWLDGQLDGYRKRDDEMRHVSEDDPW